jgi:hypothetical protein
MAVAHAGRDRLIMNVAVVLVVLMLVFMLHRLVPVFVQVVLGQVQPHAQRHQQAGSEQRLAEKPDRKHRPEERGH